MNSYYALIYLNRELKAKVQDYVFVTGITQQKNLLELFFHKNGDELKLVVSTDSVKTALFLDTRVSVKRANVASFFEELNSQTFITSELADEDRLLNMKFTNGFHLFFQMYGSRPNVLLIKDNQIVDAFKDTESVLKAEIPVAHPPQKIRFSQAKGSLRRRIFAAYPFLQRSFIDDIILEYGLEKKNNDEIEKLLESIDDATRTRPEFRIMSDGRFCLIPSSFLPDQKAESFNSIHDAVRISFFSQRSQDTLSGVKRRLNTLLDKEIKRLENLIQAGDQSIKSLERAQEYGKMGNILMAHAHEKKQWGESIELDDIYSPGEKILIPLKPDLSLSENAAIYFDKKRKSERSFDALNQQAEMAAKSFSYYNAIRDELNEIKSMKDYREFQKKYADEPLFSTESHVKSVNKKPYWVTKYGSYEVWIGKNAKSNDALLRDAHKDDIWMHARGVSGSHVVIRMNKKQHDPDSTCLETAAGWAAWKSKARGSELVPVIWTRKKFVRKPKGAHAGAVLVEQEKVVIVEPLEPKNEYFT